MASQEDLQQRAQRLLAQLDEGWPEAWIPEPGDQLIGTFRELRPGQTSYGPCLIMVVQPTDVTQPPVAVWLLHAALKSEMDKLRPPVGSLVAIRYEGKRQPASGVGQPYDAYRVAIEREDGSLADWDALSRGSGPAAPAAPAAPWDGHAAQQQPPPAGPDVCFECGSFLESQPHEPWCSQP